MEKDITGQRFGKLVALERVFEKGKPIRYLCRCDCGVVKPIPKSELTRKERAYRSCGCNKKTNGVKHGLHGTPAYEKWRQMRARVSKTYEPKNYCYKHVTICERWNDFANFLEDMGEPPEGLTLERIDNSLGYSRENCKWATWREQMNNKSDTRKYTHNGLTLSVAEWSRRTGIVYTTLIQRLNRGVPFAAAIEK